MVTCALWDIESRELYNDNEVVPVLGTVLIVFVLGTAFRLVLKIVPVPELRARTPSLNRA